MAASLDDSSSTGADTLASSKTVTAPAGGAAGKIVVITVETWTSSAEPTVTNWAALGFAEWAGAHATMVTAGTAGNQSIRKAWKRLTAADASWNLTFSASTWSAAHAELWSGLVAAGDPLDVAATATGSTGYPNAAVTTTVAGDAVSNSAATFQAVTTTPPTGYTERQDSVTLHTNTQVAGAAGSVPGTGGTVSANGEICVSTVALKPAAAGGITPAAETDTALTPARQRLAAAGTAAETDTGQTPTRSRLVAITPATETDTALTPARTRTTAVPAAAETDTALSPAQPGGTPITPAVETDTAITPARSRIVIVAAAGETDQALSPARSRVVPVTAAVETDTARTPAQTRVTPVLAALETDEALDVHNPNEVLRDLDLRALVEPGRFHALVEPNRLHALVEPGRFRTEIEA